MGFEPPFCSSWHDWNCVTTELFGFLSAGVTYKFDNSKNSWVVKDKDCGADNEESEDSDSENKDDGIIKQDMSSGTYGYEGDTHTYTDATDGTVYVWDREKNAWFPKVMCQFSIFPRI
jgi:HIV Tat-specific factor 1